VGVHTSNENRVIDTISASFMMAVAVPPNRVGNVTSMWIDGAETLWKGWKKYGDVPYVKGRVKRNIDCACIPVCCFPCILWSCIWRVVACPCMCMCKGAGYMCGGNGCTDCSDLCIGTMCNEVNKKMQMPAMPAMTEFDPKEKARVISLFSEMVLYLEKSGAKFGAPHYLLVDAMFKSTLMYPTVADGIAFMKKCIV